MPALSDLHQLHDQRVGAGEPLGSPALLRATLPLSPGAAETVARGRTSIQHILDGDDDRLFVVVGPCSVHDPHAAVDYAHRLADLASELDDALVVAMRVYFEKPRTILGWKGLVNDPLLDGSCQVKLGLTTARRVLCDVVEAGLPTACEFLDPILPQYLADVVSWGAIGARTVESQIHRQLASGLSMPVGIKNATNGDVGVAVSAVRAAMARHMLTGIDDAGVAAVF
ncbi:MAG TPA: 3-deoxy-7-phosphoheptulonate synthase, partial [Acidimicrobiales bacterium]